MSTVKTRLSPIGDTHVSENTVFRSFEDLESRFLLPMSPIGDRLESTVAEFQFSISSPLKREHDNFER